MCKSGSGVFGMGVVVARCLLAVVLTMQGSVVVMAQQARENMKAYPAAGEGMKRVVVYLAE